MSVAADHELVDGSKRSADFSLRLDALKPPVARAFPFSRMVAAKRSLWVDIELVVSDHCSVAGDQSSELPTSPFEVPSFPPAIRTLPSSRSTDCRSVRAAPVSSAGVQLAARAAPGESAAISVTATARRAACPVRRRLDSVGRSIARRGERSLSDLGKACSILAPP